MNPNLHFDLISDIATQLKSAKDNTAFVIDEEEYSYGEFSNIVASFYNDIFFLEDRVIGVIAENSINSYAAIIAILLSGKAYTILHPSYPKDRNAKIIELASIKSIIVADISNVDEYSSLAERVIICNSNSTYTIDQINYCADIDSVAYIIFTSGSTGEPKGVPITRRNLNAFYRAYHNIGWQLDSSDRMLQMFELTFDVSVVSTLYPLTIGASIYTVGYKDVKYLKVFDLLEEHKLTFAAVAPSVLQMISPYFDEINLPNLKYLVVTAEASSVELLTKFRPSIPSAQIYNLYGPTEGTIYCTYYNVPKDDIQHHNGMVGIGKPFYGVDTIIVDDAGSNLSVGQKGEMWISGDQIMSGYFNDEEKSGEVLVVKDGKTYYKTGDLCIFDPSGDIIYCGRKDYQVKIQGFRIELSEIEYNAKQFFSNKCNVVVIPAIKEGICSELWMAVELAECDKEALKHYLEQKLPHYMIPKKIDCIAQFPTSASNKVDRKAITKLIS